MMTKQDMAELMQEHAGHDVEIVTYYAGSDDPEHPEEWQLECGECGECLFGFAIDGKGHSTPAQRVMVGQSTATSVT